MSILAITWDTLCKGANALYRFITTLLTKVMLALIWFYRKGHQETRAIQRRLAGLQTHIALQPLRRLRLRPRTLKVNSQ